MKYPWTWFPVFSKKIPPLYLLHPLLLKPPATKSTSFLTRIHPPPTLIFLKGFFLTPFETPLFLTEVALCLSDFFVLLPSAFTLSKATTADESISPPPLLLQRRNSSSSYSSSFLIPPHWLHLQGEEGNSPLYAMLCSVNVLSFHTMND